MLPIHLQSLLPQAQLTVTFTVAGEHYLKPLIQSPPPQLTDIFTIANRQLKLTKLERSMEQRCLQI